MATERLAPFSTSVLTSRMVLPRALFAVCSAKIDKARSSESPELIMVENCLLKTATSLTRIRSLRPGILISFWRLDAFFSSIPTGL